MKLAVEFPAVSYREGPQMVARMARGIEAIGYDHIDIFDHVIMGYNIEGREKSYYSPKMPVLECVSTLSFIAAITERVTLGTEVLVLPQRQPALVAKQFSTLDLLSGGRVRLGVGVGWQESEFDALGENFADRGRRTDEAIDFLRACWREERINFDGDYYKSVAMVMAPQSPQGGGLPIWVGGNTPPAFRRCGKYGDGWLASRVTDADFAKRGMDAIREAAVQAGRDPEAIGWQSMIAPPLRPGDEAGKTFYADPDRVVERAVALREMGFEFITLNATSIFQGGARGVEPMLDTLQSLHDRLRAAVG